MKKIIYTIFFIFIATAAFAGNKDRSGQAGAAELLTNPFARTAGLHGLNTATVHGTESLFNNVAGLSFLRNKTEITFANSMWLKGSGTSVNAIGFAQKLGESSVLGLSIMSMGFGDIEVTTTASPDGGTGASFSPQFLNIGLSYARSFSKSIHVGFLARLINESIVDATASGIAMDMGIQYVTGAKDNLHFGITLRNVGMPMKFRGDGLAIKLTSSNGYIITADQRSDKFELPSQLQIGAGYDIHAGTKNKISLIANFASNSFGKDQLGAGLEYAFDEKFMARVGYRYEEKINSDEYTTTAYTGLSAGVSIEVPLKEDGPTLGIDYGYRATNPFKGTHTIGVKFTL